MIDLTTTKSYSLGDLLTLKSIFADETIPAEKKRQLALDNYTASVAICYLLATETDRDLFAYFDYISFSVTLKDEHLLAFATNPHLNPDFVIRVLEQFNNQIRTTTVRTFINTIDSNVISFPLIEEKVNTYLKSFLIPSNLLSTHYKTILDAYIQKEQLGNYPRSWALITLGISEDSVMC